MSIALISLGSNLGDSVTTIKAALQALSKLEGCRMQAVSSLYITKPWGYVEQPDFINCACKLECSLDALTLLHLMQNLEQKFHRVRQRKYGPRTLDLDLIAFDDEIVNTKELILPHPHLHERAFVLVPLSEIAENFLVPKFNQNIGTLCSLLTAEQKQEVRLRV